MQPHCDKGDGTFCHALLNRRVHDRSRCNTSQRRLHPSRCCDGRPQLPVHGCICHSVLDTESRHAGVNSKMKSYSKLPVKRRMINQGIPVTPPLSFRSPASRHRSRSGATNPYAGYSHMTSITGYLGIGNHQQRASPGLALGGVTARPQAHAPAGASGIPPHAPTRARRRTRAPHRPRPPPPPAPPCPPSAPTGRSASRRTGGLPQTRAAPRCARQRMTAGRFGKSETPACPAPPRTGGRATGPRAG